jgi:VWFA-related protein
MSWSTIRLLSLTVAGIVLLAGSLPAQNAAPAPVQETPQTTAQQAAANSAPVIRTTAGEVLLDVVVTDKKGHVIKDLKPGDVTVLDNGAPQKIRSFELVSESVHLDNATLSKVGLVGAASQPQFNMVVMIFDNLDAAGRTLARSAATDLIRRDLGPADFTSIYSVDERLYALQPFTTNKAELIRAVDVATGGSATVFAKLSNANFDILKRAQDEEQTAISAISSTGRTAPGAGSLSMLAQAKMDEITADALSTAISADMTDAGRAKLNALLSIVNSLHQLPGRKTVLYFTQWIPVNANTDFLFKGLINSANESNVAFYAVDPSGLRLTGENEEATNSLNQASRVSATESNTGPVSQEQATLSDYTESVAYASSRKMMDALSSDTGGFAVYNTNDLRPYMDQVSADTTAHYELAYAPSSGLDGKFHPVEIKLARRGLVARTRAGYFALPAMSQPVMDYEAPLVAMLDKNPSPADLPLNDGVLAFPQGSGGETVDVSLESTLGAFKFSPVVAAKGVPAGLVGDSFTALIAIKDSSGEVVRMFSYPYNLKFTAQQMDSNKERPVIFERQTVLSPGDYKIETAIYEPGTQKATIHSTSLTVPATAAPGPRVSSVVLVAGTQAMAPTSQNLLSFERHRIIPNLSGKLQSGAGDRVQFFFIAYPPKNASAQMAFAVKKDGATLGQTPFQPLPTPDAAGQIPDLAGLPAALFATPGHYEVDVLVQAGGQTASSGTQFDVVAN